jgi:hypothetical protein
MLGSPALATPSSDAETCKGFGELARIIMKLRQKEMPMHELMAAIKRSPAGGKDVNRKLVLRAYEQPRYATEKHQKLAIGEFGNAAERTCWYVVESEKP